MLTWLGAAMATGGCLDGAERATYPAGLGDTSEEDPWADDFGTCGDGLVDPGEDCDGEDFAGLSCERMGLGQGTLTCGFGCTVDASGCSTTPDVPSLLATASPIKRIDFEWTTAAGADHYRLMERTAEDEPYEQVGDDLEGESISIEVPLHLRAQAGYVLQACNEHECTDSDPVRAAASLVDGIGYVKASNTGDQDKYGTIVALSADGNTMAVGAELEDGGATGIDGDQADESIPSSGAVYVYTRGEAGEWSPQAYVKAPNTGQTDRFGSSLALSDDGSTLVVGAFKEASAATGIDGDQTDDSVPNSGAVYVYARDEAESWSLQAYVKAMEPAEGDGFGRALALSGDGDVLAVGAHRDDGVSTGLGGIPAGDPLPDAGAVHVYTRNETGMWLEQAYITASNPSADDRFGKSLALSGDGTTLVVGAVLEDGSATGIDGEQDDASLDSGAAYLYERDGTGAWHEQAYIKASNTAPGDQLGGSVALSEDGTTLAVGARLGDTTGLDGAFPSSDAGVVYLYKQDDTGAWRQDAALGASNAEELDGFGRSVALSRDGSILAVGAEGEDGGARGLDGDQADDSARESGAVYLFTRDDAGPWSQRAYVKAPNTDPGDDFGWSVSLSGDGSILAVGAPGEQGTATGIGGAQDDNGFERSGAVYLY